MIIINNSIQIRLLNDYSSIELLDIKNKLLSIINKQKEYMDLYDYSVAMIRNILEYEKINEEGYRIILFVLYYNNEPCGTITIHSFNYHEPNSAEVGFWLDEKKQGNGIVSLSLSTIIKYCFKELKLSAIYGSYSSENVKSENIFKRNNFEKFATTLRPKEIGVKSLVKYVKLTIDKWENSNDNS